MENFLLSLKSNTRRARSLWTSILGMFRDPDRLWQIILACVFCAMLAIATAAVLASQWAMSVEVSTKPPPKKADTLSMAELDGVVKKYEERTSNFADLIQRAPEAPVLEHGFGPVTPISAYEESEIEKAMPVAATTTSAP